MYPKTFPDSEYGDGDVLLWCFDRPCVKAGGKLYMYLGEKGYVVTNRLPCPPFVYDYFRIQKEPDGIIRVTECLWRPITQDYENGRVNTREQLEAEYEEFFALGVANQGG